VTLETGDYLICYTDGVTETPRVDGTLYGETRLKEVIQKTVAEDVTPSELVDAIKEDVDSYRGDVSQRDDVTILVAKV
jgi:serine phosphatase RsbU (regulator of sigma subunit)